MRVFRVNLRCWISSFVLPLIRDLFVMVLSETLKRAVKGIAAFFFCSLLAYWEFRCSDK